MCSSGKALVNSVLLVSGNPCTFFTHTRIISQYKAAVSHYFLRICCQAKQKVWNFWLQCSDFISWYLSINQHDTKRFMLLNLTFKQQVCMRIIKPAFTASHLHSRLTFCGLDCKDSKGLLGHCQCNVSLKIKYIRY